MILKLTHKAEDYFRLIKKMYPNSYYTEDDKQIIIGIDVTYMDSKKYSYDDIREFVKKNKGLSDFSGLFGVFSYETLHYFEEIQKKNETAYLYPEFIFADAKAYIHFDKLKLIFEFFGCTENYADLIHNMQNNFYIKKPKFNRSSTVLANKKEEKEKFFKNVEKIKEYIRKGDVFQVVISSRTILEAELDPYEFFVELTKKNPSPYMFYFPASYGIVIGSSPEILLKIENNKIYTAPIAGTKARGKTTDEDIKIAENLLSDEKELAEHKMLIDLARNDISKYGKKGSIKVENPMHIEYFQHVMHIVSNVNCELDEKYDIFDVLSTVFPAGTLSGAPKIRAMEIIAELETEKRNIYGGCLGFLGYNGDSQLAIIIRTAFYKDNKYYIQSGAGIVYDSVPENEYHEMLNKRKSIMEILEKEELL